MILYDHLFTVMHLNLSIETDMVGKQCRPTSDAALPDVWSASTLFVTQSTLFLDSSSMWNRHVWANSVEPDQTPHYPTSDQHLHCLSLSPHFLDSSRVWNRHAWANSVEPDQMPHYPTSDQHLHCLSLSPHFFRLLKSVKQTCLSKQCRTRSDVATATLIWLSGRAGWSEFFLGWL